MNKQEIFDALGLGDQNSGVFAGEWLDVRIGKLFR